MEFGMLFNPDEPTAQVEKAQLTEDVGFDFIGLTDSQSLFRELYTSAANVAAHTNTIRIGTTVTNPVTRHPVVTASAICTLDEISDGRTFLGVATGDSALHTIGEHPATLDEMEPILHTLRTLTNGEPTEYGNEKVRLQWVQERDTDHPMQTFLAAEGPKTLALAGRAADGVLIGTGLEPALIENAIETVNSAARDAGRNPDDIEKYIFAKTNLRDDRDTAIDEMKMSLAASANHAFRYTLDGKHIPEEHVEPIKELIARYNSHEHEQTGETINKELVDELGLTDYLANRFTVIGTPTDCIEKLTEITTVPGIDGVLMTAYTDDKQTLVSRLGTEVLPALN